MDSTANTAKQPQKIIIDTDPGIDDAMAIMVALKAHKKGIDKVLAITLVNGNSSIENSQINILRVLETYSLEDEVKLQNETKVIHFHCFYQIIFIFL